MSATILIIEDEADLRTLLRHVLERAGYRVLDAATGQSGLRSFYECRPDLVLLDVGLPDTDGWTVLQRLREMSAVPVVLLTAHGSESDKVRGLDAGADDYLTKPIGRSELIARVNAALRRNQTGQPELNDTFTDGPLMVDFVRHEVTLDGVEVVLTPLEHRVLVALVRHSNHVLSPTQLLEHAWDNPSGVGPERVKFVVARLRRKLAGVALAGPVITTVRSFGYRYSTSSAGADHRG
ncbi:unannotated protein [freshwater metagenome]|uniref:Unannotated protein n=1 Tax=freshwater metagenome TaxID=449393 RepID=A0A6J7ENY7_9ZZZZ|nr:response regulator [Actinomycetota bacterium]